MREMYEWEAFPKCPYCDAINRQTSDIDMRGPDTAYVCDFCGKDVAVVVHTVYSYSTYAEVTK